MLPPTTKQAIKARLPISSWSRRCFPSLPPPSPPGSFPWRRPRGKNQSKLPLQPSLSKLGTLLAFLLSPLLFLGISLSVLGSSENGGGAAAAGGRVLRLGRLLPRRLLRHRQQHERRRRRRRWGFGGGGRPVRHCWDGAGLRLRHIGLVAAGEVRLRHLRLGPRLPPQPGQSVKPPSTTLFFLEICFSWGLEIWANSGVLFKNCDFQVGIILWKPWGFEDICLTVFFFSLCVSATVLTFLGGVLEWIGIWQPSVALGSVPWTYELVGQIPILSLPVMCKCKKSLLPPNATVLVLFTSTSNL